MVSKSERPLSERCIRFISDRVARFSSSPASSNELMTNGDIKRMLLSEDAGERVKGLTLLLEAAKETNDESELMKQAITSQYLDVRLEATRMLKNEGSLAHVIIGTRCSETKSLAMELQSMRGSSNQNK